MFRTIMWNWLMLSALCGGVMLLLLSVRRIIGEKTGAWWRSLLWVIILVRIGIPIIPSATFSFEIPAAIVAIFDTSSEAMAPKVRDSIELPVEKAVVENEIEKKTQGTLVVAAEVLSEQQSGQVDQSSEGRPIDWFLLGMLVYSIGFIVFAGFFIRDGIAVKRLNRSLEPIVDPGLNNLLKEAKKSLGIKDDVGLAISKEASTPYLVGIFRPTIVLPTYVIKEMDRHHLSLVMIHELIHYKYFDILKLWLMEVIVCLHWYNPVLHLSRRTIRQDIELACDERVIRQLTPRQYAAYGEVLTVATLRFVKEQKYVLTAHMAGKRGTKLKERLVMIKNYNRTFTRISGAIIVVSLVYVLAACTTMNIKDTKSTEASEGITVEAETMSDIESTTIVTSPEVTSEPTVEVSEPVAMEIHNYYKAVTGEEGNQEDGKLFAAGFLGMTKEANFQKVSDDYGYNHLSQLPQWTEAGGNEAWVVITKYESSTIVIRALQEFTLEDGSIVSNGEVLLETTESVVFYASSKNGQPTVEAVISYGDESIIFVPGYESEMSEVTMPNYVWNISEFEPRTLSVMDKELLDTWVWEGDDGGTQTLTISKGSEENEGESNYFMLWDTYYPGADAMGPIGGPLEIDGDSAIYTLNVSEGSLKSKLEIVQEGDSLTFTWVGEDFALGLRTLGESITFERYEL